MANDLRFCYWLHGSDDGALYRQRLPGAVAFALRLCTVSSEELLSRSSIGRFRRGRCTLSASWGLTRRSRCAANEQIGGRAEMVSRRIFCDSRQARQFRRKFIGQTRLGCVRMTKRDAATNAWTDAGGVRHGSVFSVQHDLCDYESLAASLHDFWLALHDASVPEFPRPPLRLTRKTRRYIFLIVDSDLNIRRDRCVDG